MIKQLILKYEREKHEVIQDSKKISQYENSYMDQRVGLYTKFINDLKDLEELQLVIDDLQCRLETHAKENIDGAYLISIYEKKIKNLETENKQLEEKLEVTE